MEFSFTKEQEILRKEVRDFLKQELTDELLRETESEGHNYGSPLSREFAQKLGAKGLLTPTWPKEYGGLEYSEVARFLIYDELYYFGAPTHFIGAQMAGPTILRHGSEELKRAFLPPIARGEIEFALGYSEPGAGSDLGSLEMLAKDKGDYFVVNGQKIFNTHCHIADYHWLAVRTSPDVAKHKGISLLIVDLKSPGITINPLWTMVGFRTNEAFYDNVKVPKKNLVGEINHGWDYIMTALEYERVFPVGMYRNLFDRLVEYTKETKFNGKPLCKNPLVRQKLAQTLIEIEATHLLYYRLAYLLDHGKKVGWQSAMQKLFMTEVSQHVADVATQVLGLIGQLMEGSKGVALKGKAEHYYRWSFLETIYGGTSEIQRDIIATRGLGLPRR